MLNFVYGRAGTGKTSYCLEQIVSRIKEDPLGKPLILLVPDHMTFIMERQLAQLVQAEGGFSRAYILGKNSLMHQILNRYGGSSRQHLNDLGKQLILSQVLQETDLGILARPAKQVHFTQIVMKIIEEFKVGEITPAVLREELTRIENDVLKAKLEDFLQIYEGFQQKMSGQYCDAQDLFAIAIHKLSSASNRGMEDFFTGSSLWIDGYDAFTEQYLHMLDIILPLCQDITITINIDSFDPRQQDMPMALFHWQYIMYQQLGDIARRHAIPIKHHPLKRGHRFHNASLAAVERQLFTLPIKPSLEVANIKVVEVANRRLECEAVAGDIIRRCRDENYKWQDIGIMVRDEDSYTNILKQTLDYYGILAFSDSKYTCAHHPLAELIRSSIEALRTWQYEPLFRVFKTDLVTSERVDVDALENYVLEFGIKGVTKWLQPEPWTYISLRDYFEATNDDSIRLEWEEGLKRINEIRDRLITPLRHFYREIHEATTMREFAMALYNYLVELDIPTKLEAWYAEAMAQEDFDLAKEHQQVWNSICKLLEQLVHIAGDDITTLTYFEKLLNDGLDDIQIAIIPPSNDYVTIAGFDHNTLNNKRAIYIVGANEYAMPRKMATEGMLTDNERKVMISHGLNIGSGVLADSFAERYILYKAFSLAKDYLWVSYSLADNEGKGLTRSKLVNKLFQIFPTLHLQAIAVNPLQRDIGTMVSSRAVTAANLGIAIRSLWDNGSWQLYWNDVYNYFVDQYPQIISQIFSGIIDTDLIPQLSKDLAGQLYTHKHKLAGSVTRFELFFNCPFKHYLQYGLKVKERREYKFAAPDLGNLLHRIMYEFGMNMVERGLEWSTIDLKTAYALVDELIEILVPQLQNNILDSSNANRHLITRIRSLAHQSIRRLLKYVHNSSFNPQLLESRFASTGIMPPLSFETPQGYLVEINGQIDRVDSFERYFLVIDYKSGYSSISLLEVLYGLRLQLLTYLLVAYKYFQSKSADCLPAGMLYCFLKSKVITSKTTLSEQEIDAKVDQELKMPGWLLDDANLIKQLDSSGEFIKVRINKDGSLASSSKSSLKTAEEFQLLLDYVQHKLEEASTRILDGDIMIYPIKQDIQYSACTYCSYQAICRFEEKSGSQYNEMKSHVSDDDIYQEMKEVE